MRDIGLGFPILPQLKWSEPYKVTNSSLDKGLELLSCFEKSLMD